MQWWFPKFVKFEGVLFRQHEVTHTNTDHKGEGRDNFEGFGNLRYYDSVESVFRWSQQWSSQEPVVWYETSPGNRVTGSRRYLESPGNRNRHEGRETVSVQERETEGTTRTFRCSGGFGYHRILNKRKRVFSQPDKDLLLRDIETLGDVGERV